MYAIVETGGKQVKVEVVDEYKKGRTPNPCVVCNENIKFGKLLEISLEMGADFIATGHYAKVCYDKEKGRYLLKKAEDLKVLEDNLQMKVLFYPVPPFIFPPYLLFYL